MQPDLWRPLNRSAAVDANEFNAVCGEARLWILIVSAPPLAEHFTKMFYVPSGNFTD